MDLKTTTRPRRHMAEFKELRRFLAAPPSGRPLLVANVGPGLAVRYFGRLGATNQLGWDIFRRIESGIRRVPMPDAFYESYETAELIGALGDIPFELTLVDINPRVVRIVADRIRNHKIRHVVADLGEARSVRLAPYRAKFDLVVAFAVIGRVKDQLRDNASANVHSLLRPGGILLGGTEVASNDLVHLSDNYSLYRKTISASGDAPR